MRQRVGVATRPQFSLRPRGWSRTVRSAFLGPVRGFADLLLAVGASPIADDELDVLTLLKACRATSHPRTGALRGGPSPRSLGAASRLGRSVRSFARSLMRALASSGRRPGSARPRTCRGALQEQHLEDVTTGVASRLARPRRVGCGSSRPRTVPHRTRRRLRARARSTQRPAPRRRDPRSCRRQGRDGHIRCDISRRSTERPGARSPCCIRAR